jgi:hypothetical protein
MEASRHIPCSGGRDVERQDPLTMTQADVIDDGQSESADLDGTVSGGLEPSRSLRAKGSGCGRATPYLFPEVEVVKCLAIPQ